MKVDYRLDDHPVCPALYKLPGEGVPAWRCRCTRPDGRPLLRNKRHASEADCIPLAEVEALQRAHPEIKTLANARRLYWLWREFSGREKPLDRAGPLTHLDHRRDLGVPSTFTGHSDNITSFAPIPEREIPF